jgi:hypothetical protein
MTPPMTDSTLPSNDTGTPSGTQESVMASPGMTAEISAS